MWHTGLSSRVVKNRHEHIGTQKRATQFNRQRRGQRQRWVGQETCRRKSKSGKTATIQGKKGYEGRNGPHPCQPKKRHDLPAILRRCTSKSNARATGSSQGSVRNNLVNSVVRLRLNRLLRQIFFNGRCQTAFCRSKRTTRGTVVKTSFSNVCTMVAEQLG